MLFVGDTCFGESYQESREARGAENVLKARGYDAPLEGMMATLRTADFVVANLETPVTDLADSPFSGRKRYIHRADVVETPRALTRGHVAAVSLANNHSFVGEGIGDGDERRLGVGRDVGGVDFADPPGAENCNSYIGVSSFFWSRGRIAQRSGSGQSAGRLTARNCCIVASNARRAAISSGR